MRIKIDATQANKEIKRLVRSAFIDEKVANRIVQQEFRKGRMELARLIAAAVNIPISAAKRRVSLRRGRRRAKERWKYASLGTYGQSLKVHAGRLKTRYLKARKRRKKGTKAKRGVIVNGQLIQGSFYYNPKGKILKGKARRVYYGSKFKAVTTRPNIAVVYKRRGQRVLNKLADRIIKRINNEALLVRSK